MYYMPKRHCTMSLGQYPNCPSHSLIIIIVKMGGGCQKQVRPNCHTLHIISTVIERRKNNILQAQETLYNVSWVFYLSFLMFPPVVSCFVIMLLQLLLKQVVVVLYLKSISTVIENEKKKRMKKKTYCRTKRCHPSLNQMYMLHRTTSTCCCCHELHVYMYLYTLPHNHHCIFFFS